MADNKKVRQNRSKNEVNEAAAINEHLSGNAERESCLHSDHVKETEELHKQV